MTKENTAGNQQELDEFVDELKPGTELLHGQYTISRFLNHGGFGITYLAKDSLERDVVIKECFPGAFCRRSRTIVGARSRAHQNEFKSIVKLFIQEARSLSKLVHPNIVGVHQVFEDNDTAYMAIDYVEGRDMLDIVEDKSVQLEPSEIISMTEKLLSAVGFIHENNMLHRDISPDNILLNPDGEPILIDFGAAREQASKTSRALSALRVVKDGYSPQEFYITGSEQGPWSDLYALGASLFHIISGEAPVDSQTRLAAIAEGRDDPYNKLAGRFDGYPYGFLEAIDKAMEAVPKRRVQTAAEWAAMFDNTKPRLAVVDSDPTQTITDIITDQSPASANATPANNKAADADVDVSAITKMVEDNQRARDEWETQPQAAAVSGGEKKKGGMGPIVLGGGLVALGAIAYVLLGTGGSDEPVTPVQNTQQIETTAETNTAVTETTSQQPTEQSIRATTNTTAPETEATETVVAEPVIEPVITEPVIEEPVVVETVTEVPVVAEETVVAEAPETVAEEIVSTTATVEEPVEEVVAIESIEEPIVTEEVVLETAIETVGESVEATPVDTSPMTDRAPTQDSQDDAVTVSLARNQISFAHWDIVMPFEAAPREINGESIALITDIAGGANLQSSGMWIDQGTSIYSVNGTPISPSASIETLILNDMQIDPDGFTRSIVEYKARGERNSELGLLAVEVVRNLGLQNGVLLHTENDGSGWVTSVISVQNETEGGLRPGDVLVREAETGRVIRSDTAIEEVLRSLVTDGIPEARFSVDRGSDRVDATMLLVTEQ